MIKMLSKLESLRRKIKYVMYYPKRYLYWKLDGLIDPLKLMNNSNINPTQTNITSNGKCHSIHSATYWDKQWPCWGERKRWGKDYYYDVPLLILNQHNKARVIEPGCGTGYFAENLYNSDFNKNKITTYYGFDFSGKAIKICQSRFKDKLYHFAKKKVETLTVEELNKYNALVAIDFLEHLKKETLYNFIHLIKQSNITHLYFVTPHLIYVNNPKTTEHINFFSKRKMQTLLSEKFNLSFVPYRGYTEFLIRGERK